MRVMAEEQLDTSPEGTPSGPWGRGWASAGAVIATILLVALVIMVTLSGRARDRALAWERHTQEVMLLTKTVDATMARSEAALGRYVLDEKPKTGSLYYSEWRLAARQIDRLRQLVRADRQQRIRVARLQELFQQRGEELALAARMTGEKQSTYGIGYYYQAGQSPTLLSLRRQLERIADSEHDTLVRRMAETQMFAIQASKWTEWLGWLGVLVGIGAITLGLAAYHAISERVIARREAESEGYRAMALEQAVQERTRELRDANLRLQAEASERAAAEAQLRQVQKMEAVGQLTGGIAHDFNNMLAVVVGGLDLARRKLRGPRQDVEFHLDNAMEGATRAAQLTRRLLAFARAEPLMAEPVAPAELVGGMLDLVDRSIGERISVQTRFTREPWFVWVDAHQLENAIVNLAVNARDAMDGQGQLRIDIDNVALGQNEVGSLDAGDYICIAVSDTGTGIPPEHIERVFEPFFTTKPVGKGTGLGLSQIFGFARQSGGDVLIRSEVGAGTQVSIYLPRSIEAAEAYARRTAQLEAQGSEPAAVVAGARILLVEDDPRVSRSTVGALEELGYAPLACASGAEALDLLARGTEIDLVITDVMMPEMTGPELVRSVGRDYPEIAILFVTGYVGEAGEGEDLSGYDILRKPFTVAGLADAVARALGSRFSGLPPEPASEAAE
jgi:signal transduction histidine kinase/ActR/RegA family two-component response regulator